MSKLNKEILFKKFEILNCYKKNEHSAVYLANHVYLEKKVFLKVLNTETIPDSTITERFKREAKLLAQLEHPNITKVLDFGMFKEHFYISFEYFESKNLRELLVKKILSDEKKKEIFIQLVKGLDFAHKKNIIHRDIKPENILVNENYILKITDFGLAQNSLDNLVTQQYSVVGTPAYMSPEQIQGEKLTIQSDLFSLGITAAEIFSEKNPFLGKDTSETINNIISFDEQNNNKLFNNFTEDIQKVLKGLLAANPNDRFNSCSEILTILKIEDDSLLTGSRNRNNKQWVIVTFIIIPVLVIAYFLINPGEPEQIAASKPPEKIKTKNDSQSKESELNKPVQNDDKPNTNQLLMSEKSPKTSYSKKTIEPNDNTIVENIIKNAEFGELYIKCYPWAKVYLDNKFMETTPLTKNISAKSGNYLLTLIHPDYPEYNDSITITADKLSFVEVNLDTLFGYFECQVYPWSELYINGQKKGVTPLDAPIRLTEGNYMLTLKNPQYKSIESAINIKRNDTLRVKFNMKKQSIN